MPIEEGYTDAFDASTVAWVEVGNSPYLHDTDADYIDRASSKLASYQEGNWTFPASAGSGTINSVKLRVEDRRSNASGDASVVIYVWDGSAWNALSLFCSWTAYAWEEIDVSAILNTWAKINAAKVYVVLGRAGVQTDTSYIRRLTRKVDYAPVSAQSLLRKQVGVGL